MDLSVSFISCNRTSDCVGVNQVMKNDSKHQAFTMSTDHLVNEKNSTFFSKEVNEKGSHE